MKARKPVSAAELVTHEDNSNHLSPVSNIERAIAADAASARDVALWTNNTPWAVRILRAEAIVSTASGTAGATGQLRTADGGGGSPACGPIPLDAAGRALEGAGGGFTNPLTIAKGASLYFRMSKGDAALTLLVQFRRG